MVEAPHPESVICAESGRLVQLKVHQCVWSGEHLGNSLEAIQDCYRAHVARAEIDVALLSDEDFLVVHDLDLAQATDGTGRADRTTRAQAERLHFKHDGLVSGTRVAVLSEVAAAIAAEAYPTLLELDLKDWKPWPWNRVEELARILQPIKERVTFGGGADWNLRRLQRVDSSLRMGFTIGGYLDWLPERDGPRQPERSEARQHPDRCEAARLAERYEPHRAAAPQGAYGYFDRHPLAYERLGPTADYLRDRLGAILGLVPGVRDIHIRLRAVERMLEDGLTDLAELLHTRDMLLDVWTLNAGSPAWESRLLRAIAAGADVITSETPRELARAASLGGR